MGQENTHLVDKHGHVTVLPPKGLTAQQRLEWANRNFKQRDSEPKPVTEAEVAEATGHSPESLQQMASLERLKFANEAMAKRKG